MKPTTRGKGWRELVRPYVQKVEPVTRIAERVVSLAVHIQDKKLTPLSVIGLASVGLNSLKDLTEYGQPSGWNINLMVSKNYTIEALQGGGATVHRPPGDRPDSIRLQLHGESLYLCKDGSLTLPAVPSPEFFEWLCQMYDRVLPPVLSVGPGSGGDQYQCTPGKLTHLCSVQGARIAEATRLLLDGGRCILINGKPGIGKSTMAQEIARLLGLGRTIIFEPGAVGSKKEFYGSRIEHSNNAPKATASSGCASLMMTLQLLRPGVVIIDDIDKINLALSDLEALRTVAKCVILTSNNGEYDDVLDAAETRPGRIDEVFNVVPEHTNRRPPFDQLSEDEWEEVSVWPIASLNELEKRLQLRGGDVRLDDLRARLKKKTRSGDKMY